MSTKNAQQLVANRLVQQGGNDGRIHPAGQAQQHGVLANQFANPANLVLDNGFGRPTGVATANFQHEIVQECGGPDWYE